MLLQGTFWSITSLAKLYFAYISSFDGISSSSGPFDSILLFRVLFGCILFFHFLHFILNNFDSFLKSRLSFNMFIFLQMKMIRNKINLFKLLIIIEFALTLLFYFWQVYGGLLVYSISFNILLYVQYTLFTLWVDRLYYCIILKEIV